MDLGNVVIRPLKNMDEYRACHDLQFHTWGFSNYIDVVPDHQLMTAHNNGGLVLGAFLGENLIGFSYGFVGLNKQNRIIFCSHLLAVLPQYRGYGLGYKLKLAQREEVLKKGINIITWTFDPLETANARLNFTKLGGIARTYYLNYYGIMLDELNKGLPSDRLLLEWHLDSKRVRSVIENNQVNFPKIGFTVLEGKEIKGLLEPIPQDFQDAQTVLVEIPKNFQTIKKKNFSLAYQWRFTLRDILCHYFARGYYINYLINKSDVCNVYVLNKGEIS